MLDFEKPLLERCAFDILNKEEEMVMMSMLMNKVAGGFITLIQIQTLGMVDILKQKRKHSKHLTKPPIK